MNYSFKKTHLRLLALLLVLLTMVSMFAGCKKTEPETTPTTEEAVPPGLVEVKPTETTEPPTETTEPIDENAAVINTDNTDVRQTPSMDANPIGKLNKGTDVTIIREVSVGGVGWTLIREGWVKTEALDKAYTPENPEEQAPIQTPAQMENAANGGNTTSTNTNNNGETVLYKGTITASELNIRKDANQNSARVGAYRRGEEVSILETKSGWGRTNKGWIKLDFVQQVGATSNSQTAAHNNSTTNTNTTTGTATNAKGIILTALNIRKEPTQNSDRVGGYNYGDRVTILETSNNWGRTDKGWVSLT